MLLVLISLVRTHGTTNFFLNVLWGQSRPSRCMISMSTYWRVIEPHQILPWSNFFVATNMSNSPLQMAMTHFLCQHPLIIHMKTAKITECLFAHHTSFITLNLNINIFFQLIYIIGWMNKRQSLVLKKALCYWNTKGLISWPPVPCVNLSKIYLIKEWLLGKNVSCYRVMQSHWKKMICI